MTQQTKEHTPVKPLSEVSVNTILTMVLHTKQNVTLKMNNQYEYDIVWNYMYNEPEVIEPGTTAITIRGIVQVCEWLKKQPVVDWYARTKPEPK